jgi:hypothetical protein
MRCHLGYFTDIQPTGGNPDSMVDCLSCHDSTHTYRPGVQTGDIDLAVIARSVAKPTARNCLTCHFRNCDLNDQTMITSQDFLGYDVHMRAGTMPCQECHAGSSNPHQLPRQVGNGPMDSSCIFCHRAAPHTQQELNDHIETLSCRSCHIPVVRQAAPPIIDWNWMLVGRPPQFFKERGRHQLVRNENGILQGGEPAPVLLWDDGSNQNYSRGQRINPDQLTVLKAPGPRSLQSKVSPFIRTHATQLYDAKYRYLISPKLGPEQGRLFPEETWHTIAKEGMEAMRLPYSGQYGWASTVSHRRLHHGIAPADKALVCTDCHGKYGRVNWGELGLSGDPWTGNASNVPTPRLDTPSRNSKPVPGIEETILPPLPKL